jgi:3-phenylpropionate/trans-cinnamate dioxygenase ferredoxin subunit
MSDETPSSIDTPAFVALMPAADLAPNAVKAFELAGQRILLCRAGDEFFALENRCSHTGALLTRGRIRGDCIVCPVHGARFQLRDGKHLTPPASSGLVTFAVRVIDGQVEVSPLPIDPPGGKPDPRAFAM